MHRTLYLQGRSEGYIASFIYRARDTILDRDVAIKALPPNVRGDRTRLTRFEREARLLASLNHPNIATLHGLLHHGDEPCLVMELVEGVSLEKLIRSGPLSLPEPVRIGGSDRRRARSGA